MEAITPPNLKGYELRERIGAGGFGAVYRSLRNMTLPMNWNEVRDH